MPKLKNASGKDMFGHPVRKRVDRHERALAKMDKATFQARAARLKFVDSMLGDTWMAGSLEPVFVFQRSQLGLYQWGIHFYNYACPSIH